MSAINPASFASPTLGLQAPSGIGPGAVGLGRAGAGNGNGSSNADRRPNQQQEQQGSYAGSNPTSRSFPPAFSQPFASERSIAANNAYPPSAYPYSAYGAFGAARTGAAGYVGGGMMPSIDAYAGFPPTADYQTMQGRFPSPHSTPSAQDSKTPSSGTQNEWLGGAFQSLSLNSR